MAMIVPCAPLAIAHRGASAYAAEHTYGAYDMAIAMGADVLEVDLRLTADRVPVVVHDRTLWRTAIDPRPVADVTLAQLGRLDPSIRPLTLRQVFERYGSETRYLLDLKAPRAPLEREVLAVAADVGLCHRIQIQSFSRSGIRRARRLDSSMSCAQLYPPYTPKRAALRDMGRVKAFADAIGPHSSSVDPALVTAAHAHGLRVQPYTVNDPAEIARLLAIGVDGIITDRPDLARTGIDGGARKRSAAQ